MQLGAGREVLPAAQESLELRGGDRLDFPAQPAQRQPMNARQNAAVAPFRFRRRLAPSEITAAHDLPFRFELHQRDSISSRGSASVPASDAAVTGPSDSIQPRTAVSASSPHASRSVATQKLFPARSTTRARPAAASSSKNDLPFIHRRQDDQREQRVVQLIGVANIRPGFLGDLRDGGRIQHAGATGKSDAQGAPQLHGARAAFLERRIVQKSVRIRVQDFVRKRRRLGVIDRDRADARRDSNAFQNIRFRPSMSMASCRQLAMVSFTSG